MKKSKILIIFITLLLLIGCSSNNNDANEHLEKSLQKNLDSLREEYHLPGAVLLIKSPNYEGVLVTGETAFDSGEPITADTLFGIGSITKTIISTKILKLESEGKLDIQDSIGSYFPEYPRWGNITIEQLLNMTSGIFNYMNDETYQNDLNAHFQKDWNTDQLINIAYQHADDFKPGSDWKYSNTGYLLLGKIIEQVTHQPLSETYSASGRLAQGYYNGVLMKPSLLNNIGFASGGMAMSANDLSIFLDHLFIQKDLLPEKQLSEMITGVPSSLGKMRPPNAQFALGLGVLNDDVLGNMFSYTGVIPTGTAMYLWIPEKQTLIIALASLDRYGDKDYDILFLDKPFVKNVLGLLF